MELELVELEVNPHLHHLGARADFVCAALEYVGGISASASRVAGPPLGLNGAIDELARRLSGQLGSGRYGLVLIVFHDGFSLKDCVAIVEIADGNKESGTSPGTVL